VEKQAKKETTMKQAASRALLTAGLFLGVIFDPEDGDGVFFRNVS
jgi:hypothetical protein